MQRLTFSLDDEIVALIDEFMVKRGATNRSEALRDLVRVATTTDRVENPGAQFGLAILSYVYDLDRQELGQRLRNAHHSRHDLSIAKVTLQLDHGTGLEVSILKGPIADIQQFGHAVTNERGVRHGHLEVVPAQMHTHRHADGIEHSHVQVLG